MSKGMKFIAVLAVVGIFAIGFTTLSFAQSQPSGDVAKDTQGAKSEKKPDSSFGQKLGVQGSNPSGDLSTNSLGKK